MHKVLYLYMTIYSPSPPFELSSAGKKDWHPNQCNKPKVKFDLACVKYEVSEPGLSTIAATIFLWLNIQQPFLALYKF